MNTFRTSSLLTLLLAAPLACFACVESGPSAGGAADSGDTPEAFIVQDSDAQAPGNQDPNAVITHSWSGAFDIAIVTVAYSDREPLLSPAALPTVAAELEDLLEINAAGELDVTVHTHFVELPNPAAFYLENPNSMVALISDVERSLALRDIGPKAYDQMALYFPQGTLGKGASLGPRYAMLGKLATTVGDAYHIAHELGHGRDSAHADCQQGDTVVGYGDPFDPMGMWGGNRPAAGYAPTMHFSPVRKQIWGWAPESIQTVTQSGIYQVQAFDSEAVAPLTLEIPRELSGPNAQHESIFVHLRATEAKTQAGPLIQTGSLYRTMATRLQQMGPAEGTCNNASLPAGASYHDDDARVTIETLSVQPEQGTATVRVVFDDGASPTAHNPVRVSMVSEAIKQGLPLSGVHAIGVRANDPKVGSQNWAGIAQVTAGIYCGGEGSGAPPVATHTYTQAGETWSVNFGQLGFDRGFCRLRMEAESTLAQSPDDEHRNYAGIGVLIDNLGPSF